jgi:glucose/arabinose dehydrogenase
MKSQVLLSLALSIVLASSCKKSVDSESTTPTGPSVETNPPNSKYKPAFEGQTRIASVTSATRYQSTILTSALTSPWGIVSLPDGRFLITEKAGRMRIVSGTGAVSEPITGIPAVNPAGQGGLLGLCLDPSFATVSAKLITIYTG